MIKKTTKRLDFNEIAKSVVDRATGNTDDRETKKADKHLKLVQIKK